jgi:glycosyltransferase involved in cell wall biosynthesis
MLDTKLTLVLPAHNEADNIEAVVSRGLGVLPKVVADLEIVIVNDGSKDSTPEIIDRLAEQDNRVKVVHHLTNLGYGAALQSGFRMASGDLIMFMDADRQFDIADITALVPYVPHFDIVAGYRIDRQDPTYRKLYGKLFGLVVWVLFGVKMRDVDCAFKIYRAELLKEMQLTAPGALINTEMLARARRKGATVAQVGVRHYPRLAGQSSGGSPRVVFRAIGETLRLWATLRREETGDADAASREDAPGSPRSAIITAVAIAVTAAVAVVLGRKRSG